MEVSILAGVLPSFIIAFVGYYYSTVDPKLDMKSIADLIYYVFSPCLVYSSLAGHTFRLREFALLGLSVVILIFSLMFITFIYKRMTGFQQRGIYLPIIFMNTGNIALPMALFLYGKEGLSKAIMFHVVNVLFLYTMGVFMVSRNTNLKEFFKIPFVYAAAAGILAAVAPFRVPASIQWYLSVASQALDVLGKGAIPLLILSLGYSLKRTRLSDLKHGVAGASIRVFLGPAIAFCLILFYRYAGWSPVGSGGNQALFKDARITEAVILLMGAMPAPITSFLLNEKFNDCPEIAASMVLVGTLMGVVTIPLVLEFSQRCLMAF